MSIESIREPFEKWHLLNHGYPPVGHPDAPGGYVNPEDRERWQAYQAGFAECQADQSATIARLTAELERVRDEVETLEENNVELQDILYNKIYETKALMRENDSTQVDRLRYLEGCLDGIQTALTSLNTLHPSLTPVEREDEDAE